MCNCPSCAYTDSMLQTKGLEAFNRDIDDVRLARYVRAIETGRVPADPAYTAHHRYCTTVSGLEFTEAELRDRSQRLYQPPPQRPAYVAIPSRYTTDPAEYIAEFNQLNNLKD